MATVAGGPRPGAGLRHLGHRGHLGHLGNAAWLIALAGALSTLLLPGEADAKPTRLALLITLGLFFLVLLARLLLVAIGTPPRRLALLLLAAGVGLWACGALTVSARQAEGMVPFPSPGEAFFLASYFGIAAHLLLDVPRRAMPRAAVLLEAAIVCCAVTCLAATAVLTPLSGSHGRNGVQLFLAILYPLIDLVLAAMVLAQLLLRQRERTASTAAIATGLLLLAVADSFFLLHLGQDAYSSSLALEALWGVSLALLVGGACAHRPAKIAQPVERQNARVILLAAAAALIVLLWHPDGTVGLCVTAPALVTLVCAGARMMLALREAQEVAEAMRLSRTDELTGLPNRRALLAAADEALATDAPLGFMLLDLDGFKDINDSLGHPTGDEVLTSVAHRMRGTMPAGVTVARLGGDEFAVIASTEDELQLLDIAHRLRTALREPLVVDGLVLSVDASVGITVRDPLDRSATQLMRRADIAMYEAKLEKAGALLFDASQDGFSRQRLERVEELRVAIASGQLVVWYQPQVEAVTGRIVAMEALVRWQHPAEGLLSPMGFLSDARRFGLMGALSEAVMHQVVADARGWLDDGFTFRVAMNCAPPELLGGQLLPRLFEALHAAGLPEDHLMIEVTEDSFLSSPDLARQALLELRDHHVQTSIDDYGTGFSSLAYLRDLPVQELKIDRSFVSTIVDDRRSRMIVQTTTQMAHALGLRLVAEGIEDAATAHELAALGVDVLQGYHVARPMPTAEVAGWAQRWAAEAVQMSQVGQVSPVGPMGQVAPLSGGSDYETVRG